MDRLYHATPLHYLPSIMACSALLPTADLAAVGVVPRSSVARRDRKLGLHSYVHLSPCFLTPLLRDKLKKGFAHAVFVFDAAQVLALPTVALLPYNPKSWRHREDFKPIVDTDEQDKLLAAYGLGQFPSLEVVVRGPVPLVLAAELIVREIENKMDLDLTLTAIGVPIPLPIKVNSSAFGAASPVDEQSHNETAAYFSRCRHDRRLLPPPIIPFD